MGKIILIISLIMVLLNTLAGLIFSGYEPFNYVFSDINILITGGLIYFVANSNASDGFKIGISSFFFLTGAIRFLIAVFSNQGFENNLLLLLVV